MSYFPTSYIVPKNSPATDAFHRLHVSDVIRQFSSMAEYNDNPLIWENATVENASYSLTEYDVSSTVLDTTNAIKICSGYISSVSKSNTISFDNFINFPLVYSGLNGIQDTLTICIKTLTGFGNVGASIDWIERY